MARRLLASLVLCIAACAPTAAQTETIDAELTRVQAEIVSADAENAKYSGGLVKSLILSRLETLRQTKAMLEQRKTARTIGVTLRYTIDGKPFTLAPSAKTQLPELDREIQANNLKIAAAENEVAKYSGGLVLAMSMSTLATLRQTAAMLDQRRLAIVYELPQYIGNASTTAAGAPPAASAPPVEDNTWEIVEVGSRVTERNDTWWKYAWRVVIRNSGQAPIAVRATVELLDAGGFIVDEGTSESTPIPAGETVAITGFELVTASVAGNVAKTSAKARRVQ